MTANTAGMKEISVVKWYENVNEMKKTQPNYCFTNQNKLLEIQIISFSLAFQIVFMTTETDRNCTASKNFHRSSFQYIVFSNVILLETYAQ